MHWSLGHSREPAQLHNKMDFLVHCIPSYHLVSRKALLWCSTSTGTDSVLALAGPILRLNTTEITMSLCQDGEHICTASCSLENSLLFPEDSAQFTCMVTFFSFRIYHFKDHSNRSEQMHKQNKHRQLHTTKVPTPGQDSAKILPCNPRLFEFLRFWEKLFDITCDAYANSFI